MKQAVASIVSNTDVMPGTYLIWLEAPAIASEAKPGQFVMVHCGEDTLLPRPLSIHQRNDNKIALLFKIVGKGTHWLSQCQAGESLDLFGPLGEVAVAFGRTLDIELEDQLPDNAIYEILTAALHAEDPHDRCRTVVIVQNVSFQVMDLEFVSLSESHNPTDPGLLALVPHLIDIYVELAEADYDTYVTGESGTWDCHGDLDFALWVLTGADPGNQPEAWAEWWLAQ